MDYSKATRQLCKEQGVTMAELAHRTGQTPQNLCNRLKKGTIRFDEYVEYAKALGAQFDYTLTMPGKEAPLASASKDAVSSELALLEAQVELERRYNDFLLGITRDVRIPLNSIVGCTEIAFAHPDDNARLLDALKKISISANQISGLVDNVLSRRRSTMEIIDRVNSEDEEAEDKVIIGKRVLLVEDDQMNRDITKEILTEKGLVVETAEDGNVALEMVKNSEPGYYTCVLMDIVMPIMDGIEATKQIRALPNRIRANVPIIAMTANVLDEDKAKAKSAGMDAHISKPVSPEKIIRAIAKLL